MRHFVRTALVSVCPSSVYGTPFYFYFLYFGKGDREKEEEIGESTGKAFGRSLHDDVLCMIGIYTRWPWPRLRS